MNLELYRIFFVVAEVGNITKASEILNISQPAVTKHIKNLEEQLGNPLFIRTKRGVVLNECGEKVFLKVKQALLLLEEVEREISQYRNMDVGTIKIGVSTTLVKKYLLKYIEKFHILYPNIVIDIYTDPTKELIKKLKNGMIDFIISKFPQNRDLDLKYTKLGKTKYIFVGGSKYRDLSGNLLSVNELIKYPLLLQKAPSNSRDSIEHYFKYNEVYIEPKMSIASSSLLIDFVIMNYGIGYVTKLYVDDFLKNHQLFEISVASAPERIDYGVIQLKNNILSSYCNEFLKHLREK